MKIALVGPTYPFRGGISHYTTLLCRELRRKHEVCFFTFSRQYPAWLFPGRSDRDEDSGATLHEPGEPLLDGINPLSWLRTVRAIRRERPDRLILQWTVSYWIPMLWLLTRFAPPSTKTVMICHNAAPHEEEHPLVARFRRWLQKQVLQQADHLICHARSDAEVLQALLPGRQIQCVILPSYAGLAESVPPDGYSFEREGSPQLLFFGFVRPYKGVDLLLEAMPRVLEELPEAHLTIAGEWWKPAREADKPLPPPVQSAVTILDRYLSNEEMSSLFRAADVVVLPYRSATQSAVVQTAYAFGVPVITTAVGGLPEAVQHEKSGFLVPPENPEALAEAIIRYVKEGWRHRLEPGVAAARRRFSWATMIRAIENAG